MAKRKSTVKKASKGKAAAPRSRPVKVLQRNPFCCDVHDARGDADLTISNVQHGLQFLAEMDMSNDHVMSQEAQCGRQRFIETLRQALEYAQRKQIQSDHAARKEVAHG